MPSGNPTGRTDFVLAFQNRGLFRLIGSISPCFELSRACKCIAPSTKYRCPMYANGLHLDLDPDSDDCAMAPRDPSLSSGVVCGV